MRRMPIVYNSNSLALNIEDKDGEKIPFSIEPENAMIDRYGTIIAFSLHDPSKGFLNFILFNTQVPEEIEEVRNEFIGQFGLVIWRNSLIKRETLRSISKYDNPLNINLSSTVYSLGYGIRKPIISPLIENFKDILVQWKHNEVDYIEASSPICLGAKPLKIDLSPDALNAFRQ